MSHRMDGRFAFPRRIPPDSYSQSRRGRSEPETRRTIEDMAPMSHRSEKCNERELMHDLNERLAGFLERVHQLEHHNHLLEREIEGIRGKLKPASCLEAEYGPELRRLRQLVQDITLQKNQIEIEHHHLEEDLSTLKKRHAQETECRSEAESSISILKRGMSDAHQAKLLLDRKVESLVDEINFLKRNHEAEMSEMCDQIQEAQLTSKEQEFGHPVVTAALRDIRTQLEGHTMSDVQQAGETFRVQFARLTEAAEAKREALKASQQEIQEFKRRLQSKSIELDCAKGTREALERQLHDVEDRHNEELIHYQNTIKELENELINCKFDMSGYLREYQDLLNVKMALDVEILSYRKLLCGEEARLSSVSDPHVPLPHIYHQSPVYTLPSFSRPGLTQRRAEPKYKFVEEIITETTREIEMSEFEETGSEETDMGKEEECRKSERGGSEEESDHKDNREDEGNPLSDRQQSQVASDEKLEIRGDTNIADGEEDEGQNSEEELQNTSDLKNTDTKGENEAEENIKEKETAEIEIPQTYISSEVHDLKVGVTGESEEHLITSKEDQQGSTKEENLIAVQDVKPNATTLVPGSEEGDETQQHRAIEPTVEAKTTVLTEEEECVEIAQVISPAPKNDEKETSPMEQNETTKGDVVKTEEEDIKRPEDATHENNKDQETSPSPTHMEKAEGQQPEREGKTQTPSPALQERPLVAAETKELQQAPRHQTKI